MKEYYSFLNEFGNRLQGQMKKTLTLQNLYN